MTRLVRILAILVLGLALQAGVLARAADNGGLCLGLQAVLQQDDESAVAPDAPAPSCKMVVAVAGPALPFIADRGALRVCDHAPKLPSGGPGADDRPPKPCRAA